MPSKYSTYFSRKIRKVKARVKRELASMTTTGRGRRSYRRRHKTHWLKKLTRLYVKVLSWRVRSGRVVIEI
jgi:hypothetical protein